MEGEIEQTHLKISYYLLILSSRSIAWIVRDPAEVVTGVQILAGAFYFSEKVL